MITLDPRVEFERDRLVHRRFLLVVLAVLRHIRCIQHRLVGQQKHIYCVAEGTTLTVTNQLQFKKIKGRVLNKQNKRALAYAKAGNEEEQY